MRFVVIEYLHMVAAMTKIAHNGSTHWKIIGEYATAHEAIKCAQAIAAFTDRSFINCIPTI